MIDISQLRRMTTIAQRKIEEREDLEDIMEYEWGQALIEILSSEEIMNLLYDFIDEALEEAANQGRREQAVRQIIYPGRAYTIESEFNSKELINSATSYSHMEEYHRRLTDELENVGIQTVENGYTIREVLWSVLQEIVFPIYKENGYTLMTEEECIPGSFGCTNITTTTISW